TFRNPPQKDSQTSGRAINADGANIKGAVFLREGFIAEGEVRLPGAQIGGQLDCTGGKFTNPPRKDIPNSGRALTADGLEVGGEVHFGGGFRSEGEVRIHGAHIRGNLLCENGAFTNPPQDGLPESGNALGATGVVVKGAIFLSHGFAANGAIRLSGARVGRDIVCCGATLQGPVNDRLGQPGITLFADGVIVEGGVLLGEGFSTEGNLWWMGVQTGADFDCTGARFAQLTAQRARIGGRLFLDGLLNAENTTIDLKNASVTALVDDDSSWPRKGRLHLDGFVYDRIARGPIDAKNRLEWLSRQAAFEPQPYRQLAKVLREMGDEGGARNVLIEAGRRGWEQSHRGWSGQVSSWFLRTTIAYGVTPTRAFWWLLALTLAGTMLFGLGYLAGSITPTSSEAYATFEKQGWPPRNYQAFNPVIFALENSVPVLKLGQDNAWEPVPGSRELERPGAVNISSLKWVGSVSGKYFPEWIMSSWLLRGYRWLQIVMGWVLATLFIAGVTGVVRKE
ncbi:MAG: hypothetical protein WAO35_13975, partial [Terriglobia bacterium]